MGGIRVIRHGLQLPPMLLTFPLTRRPPFLVLGERIPLTVNQPVGLGYECDLDQSSDRAR